MSLPLDALTDRLAELPRDRTVVAYCRGGLLRVGDACRGGITATRISRGPAGRRRTGLAGAGVAHRRGRGSPVSRAPNPSGIPVYLDFNATTPVAPEVVTAMAPFWTDHFYNPSAPYPEAINVHAAVDTARAAVATLLGADVQSIVWTSGGTESNNWVLHGIWRSRPSHRRRVVLSAIEHPAVTETAAVLESLGAEIVTIPVDSRGVLRLDALDAVLDEQTALVSVMLANNEIGTLQPVA
ncbi:aminotransferase class V-fold PLP-dependent enzyme, partial [Sulfobacillus thermosulfidooxidans]|uniref:aminotransferase class V-fold PLP-dependent enzyme n=1 Tax=Sulfobacillus thermosulfidooxidans TaxID=28034 RepID=UPI001594BEC0